MEGTDRDLTTWRKASYSGGNGGDCVEVGAAWRKASYSGANGGNCVEVGAGGPVVLVRDTKDRPGAVLAFAPDAWRRFAASVKGTVKA
jgi:hypothetical protein